MIRALRPVACLSLILAAACGPKPRPNTMHEMTQNDAGVCNKNARIGNPNLHGEATLFTYVDADGAIPAAWFHDVGTIDSPTFLRCMITYALESKLAAEPIDHLVLYTVTCEANNCSIRGVGKPGEAKFDAPNAQATLSFADWADPTDKGWGYYYVQKYSDAAAAFEPVVAAHPDDARALRGLAQTLAESNGDLKRARTLADKAVAVKSEAGSLEARARVCMKAGDDDCLLRSFQDAAKAEDVQSRSLELQDLLGPAKEAGQRLEAAEKNSEAQQAAAAAAAKAAQDARLAKEDPLGCYKLTGGEQAKCTVKRCFAAGAETYAKELSKASKTSYAVGEMTVAPAGASFTVTIPIRSAAKKKDTYQDGTWTVTAGDNFALKAASSTAAVISKEHNACK